MVNQNLENLYNEADQIFREFSDKMAAIKANQLKVYADLLGKADGRKADRLRRNIQEGNL